MIKIKSKRVGAHIRALRKEKKVTARALAKALGVTPMYVTLIEQGVNKPTTTILVRIAKILQCDVDLLFVKAEMLPPFLKSIFHNDEKLATLILKDIRVYSLDAR